MAEGVLTRARMLAPVLGVLFFAVTSVTADGVENTSSSQKRRIVLLKTSCRFMENNVLFWIGGRKVVWRMVFWGFLGVE